MVWERRGGGGGGKGKVEGMERMYNQIKDTTPLAHLQIGSEQPGCWSLHKIAQCCCAVPTL